MMLSVVIVNHGTPDRVRRTVQEVRDNCRDYPVQVIVADNSDVPATDTGADVQLCMENRGFGAACNLGAAAAGGEYLLLLNADVQLPIGVLDACMDYITQHGDTGILGIRALRPDGTFDAGCLRGLPTPWSALCYFLHLDRLFPRARAFGGYHQTFLDPTLTQPVPCVSGAFMLMRTALYRALGGMDEDFFLHGEDIDLCCRAAKAGARTVYFADRHIIHEKGGSLTPQNRRRVRCAMAESMALYYDKHDRTRYPFFVRWAVRGTVRLMQAAAGRGAA